MSPTELAKNGNDAQNTLLAIQEFTRYLHDMEEDLSRQSKKLRNRETGQSAGFVAAGIHEALNYLTIVKKVIQKTQRILRKKELEPPLPSTDLGPISATATDLEE